MGEWDVRYLGNRTRAEATKTFTFERPSDLDYLPGQFFFVLLDASTTRPLEHHFSFSSSPTENDVEFTTRMTGHEFKNRLDELASGEMVHIAGPDGAFVIRPQMKKVAYLCAGIGVTPARSAVRWAVDSDALVDITVMYANRDLDAAAFREEFEALESPAVRVVSVLTEPGPAWQGLVGRIDAEMLRAQVPDFAERHFFVSGAPKVVDALVHVLVDELGVPLAQTSSEHFPGYA